MLFKSESIISIRFRRYGKVYSLVRQINRSDYGRTRNSKCNLPVITIRGKCNEKIVTDTYAYCFFQLCLLGVVNNRKEDEQNSRAAAVEIDDSDLESGNDISSENDIVYDFKNHEDSEIL